MGPTFMLILTNIGISIGLSILALAITAAMIPVGTWERYSEEEKNNVSKTMMCLVVMAFLAPWTFG